MNDTLKNNIDWAALAVRQPATALIPAQLRLEAEWLELTEGERLFGANQAVKHSFLIIGGELRLVRHGRSGDCIVLQRAHGGFFAEASLFSKRYHCDAVAGSAAALLQFPVQSFHNALENDGRFRAAWMAHLAREVRRLRTQNERLSLHGAAERILHYIETEGSDGVVELRQTRKAWAAELGLSHEALYRTLRRLTDEGRLLVSEQRIEIAPPR